MPSKKRLLLVSSAFPPVVSGSSILNRNLWSQWASAELAVVTADNRGLPSDPALALDDLRVVRVDVSANGSGPIGRRLHAHLEPLNARRVRDAIRRLHAETGFDAIFAAWPRTSFLLGAVDAAKELKLPFFVHMHDLWQEGTSFRRRPFEASVARLREGRILRAAQKVFAITEEAAGFYQRKYGIEPGVLPHSIPDSDLTRPVSLEPVRDGVVHFAGAIYPLMNLDAVVNAARAVHLSERDALLECYTTSDPVSVARDGVAGERVQLRFAPRAEMMRAQATASMLLLPLAFESTNPHEIDTVFPTKLLEYWVSGRPIVVHAPASSWAARSALREGWAEVVDRPDPMLLARKIDDLLAHPDRADELVAAAKRMAGQRRASTVARNLKEAMGWL
jgi:glycosyltransferase involved in cell wall biosynthesis